VTELGTLLKSKPDLSEKNDILPFFKTRNQLCAFIGTFAPDIGAAPEMSREFSFLGDFAADLIVGNRDNREYMAIEFEDGRKNSIFKDVGRSNTDWSQRFEHGYSQLIDWFATLDDYKKTDKFRKEFGRGHIAFSGMLIVGRNSGVSDDDRIRLDWRADKVLVDSHVVNCVTFDDLHQALERRLQLYPAASKTKKKTN
jgi:Domain of unknown function (DUF4263)